MAGGASANSIPARAGGRRATPETQSAPAMPPNKRQLIAMRSSRRQGGVRESSPNWFECPMSVLRKKRDSDCAHESKTISFASGSALVRTKSVLLQMEPRPELHLSEREESIA